MQTIDAREQVGVPDNPVQSVEVGWTVSAQVNGDTFPHLFIFSTVDGYWATGCYNLTSCNTASGVQYTSPFVQVDSTHTPGMQLSSYGTVPSAPPEMDVATLLYGGNWWVRVGGVWMGYYPGWSFSGQMTTAATNFGFGGELFDSEPNGVHTTSQMGTGTKPTTLGFGYSAYQRNGMYHETCPSGVCAYWPSGGDASNTSVYDPYPSLNGEDSQGGRILSGLICGQSCLEELE